MDKKEKGLEKIRQHIQHYVREKEEDRKRRENAARKEETNRMRAEKIFDDWVKKYEAKTRKAVRTIWGWYQEFITSQAFEELVETLGKTHNCIRISKIICWNVPRKESFDYYTKEQRLTIDISGKLFVDNCVKYGKSYQLYRSEDLLEYVALPILIEVAETIANETIWDIIDIS